MNILRHILAVAFLASVSVAQVNPPKEGSKAKAGGVTSHAQGLHGYIGFSHEALPPEGGYVAGMGF